jgi:hypothetical protein
MKTNGPSDTTKMKELILYVATASAQDANFGAVKLNKVLFFADFLAYLRRGRAITGQEYFALQEGPAPHQLRPLRDEMERDRDIAIQKFELGGHLHPLTKVVPLRSPNYSRLEAEELVIVNEVIERLKDLNGKQVSDLSHKFAGWKIAFELGEKTTIPYSAALYDPEGLWGVDVPPLPQALIDYGKELAAKFAA